MPGGDITLTVDSNDNESTHCDPGTRFQLTPDKANDLLNLFIAQIEVLLENKEMSFSFKNVLGDGKRVMELPEECQQ